MGCTETKVLSSVRRVQVSASPQPPRITTDKTDDENETKTDLLDKIGVGNDDLVDCNRLNSACFSLSLNLNESLDSRLSLSFKSQTPSAGSVDSGIFELDEEYSHVITEFARPELVRQVEKEFVPKEHLELCIMGRACPRRTSARVREYADEHVVLQKLRDEGLIQKPQLASTGGLSFEVVSVRSNAEPLARKLPPIQIEKMEQRTKRRKLTKETIHEKLIKAEQRRKQQEEEKLSRILIRPKTAVLREEADKFQDNIRTKMDKKMELYEENRQKQLQEMQERIQLKREHSAKVRLRKMLNPISIEEAIPEEET